MLKKNLLLSIILLMLLFNISQSIVKAQANNEKIDISGKIDYELKDRPILLMPGETSTILVEIENTGNSTADYIARISGDGKYLYFNIVQGCKDTDPLFPLYNPLYGSVRSPAVITLDPGHIERIRFVVFAQRPAEKVPIIMELYGAKPGTNDFFKLDEVAGGNVHITNNHLQDRLDYPAIILILIFIFAAYILIKLRNGLEIKDAFILMALFCTSLAIRSTFIENPSTYVDEVMYLVYAKSILTNQWAIPKLFLEFGASIFYFLVSILNNFFGENIDILRVISIISGTLCVCVIYLLGKSLFDRRVGVISAFFLCFCNYHIIYSRILMMDSLSLLFVFSTIYLFWEGFCKGKNKYLYFAGFMLGFGTLIKFSSLVMFPLIIFFILWTKKNIKALFDRRIILLFTVTFLTILPYLFYLYIRDVNPLYFNLVTRFEMGEPSKIQMESTLFNYVSRMFGEYMVLLTNGDYMVSWSPIFKLSAILLFPITMLYHFYMSIKRHENSSFLLIYFIVMCLLILFFSSKHRYYLLYIIPCYFILLSSLIIDSVDNIKFGDRKRCLTLIIVFIFALTAVFGFSYAVVGTMTPVYEKGEFHQMKASVLKIKEHLHQNDTETTIGTILFYVAGREGESHYLIEDYCNSYMKKAKVIPFFTSEKRAGSESLKYGIDMDGIRELKPNFIIANEHIISYYITAEEKKEFFENYQILPFSETEISNPNAHAYLVYERKECV